MIHGCPDCAPGLQCQRCLGPTPPSPSALALAEQLEAGATLIDAMSTLPDERFDNADYRFMRDHPALAECGSIMRKAAAILRTGQEKKSV